MTTYEIHYTDPYDAERSVTIEATSFAIVNGDLYLYKALAHVKTAFAAGRWNYINEV